MATVNITPKKSANGTSASSRSVPSKPLPPKTRLKKRASASPALRFSATLLFWSPSGMEPSGKTVEHRDGKLVVAD